MIKSLYPLLDIVSLENISPQKEEQHLDVLLLLFFLLLLKLQHKSVFNILLNKMISYGLNVRVNFP